MEYQMQNNSISRYPGIITVGYILIRITHSLVLKMYLQQYHYCQADQLNHFDYINAAILRYKITWNWSTKQNNLIFSSLIFKKYVGKLNHIASYERRNRKDERTQIFYIFLKICCQYCWNRLGISLIWYISFLTT